MRIGLIVSLLLISGCSDEQLCCDEYQRQLDAIESCQKMTQCRVKVFDMYTLALWKHQCEKSKS